MTPTAQRLLALTMAFGTAMPVMAADLGDTSRPIRLAIHEWTGQHITTHIVGTLLQEAGYTVEYVTAGYFNVWGAVGEGEVSASLEVWASNVPDTYWEMAKAGTVTDMGDLGLSAREGFAYPAHVAEICPGLPDWEALKNCAMQLATADTIPQGRLLDYPADWGTPGADRVAGLGLPFKAVPAGSEGALVTEIRASVEKNSPLLVVFWQPHWAVDAFDLQWVALPEGEQACYEDPAWGVNPDAVNDCDFLPTRVFKAAWPGLAETWPAAAEIIQGFTLSTEAQQPLMGAVDVDGRSVEEVAADWIEANRASWEPLVAKAVE